MSVLTKELNIKTNLILFSFQLTKGRNLWFENVKNERNLRGRSFYMNRVLQGMAWHGTKRGEVFHTNIFLFKQLFLVFWNSTISAVQHPLTRPSQELVRIILLTSYLVIIFLTIAAHIYTEYLSASSLR